MLYNQSGGFGHDKNATKQALKDPVITVSLNSLPIEQTQFFATDILSAPSDSLQGLLQWLKASDKHFKRLEVDAAYRFEISKRQCLTPPRRSSEPDIEP